jgi:hypothetical protein
MTILKKLASRKLWLAIAGVATGIAVVLGASAADVATISTAIETCIGCITALLSVVTYIKTEGRIDAAGIQKASEAVQTGIEAAQDVIDVLADADMPENAGPVDEPEENEALHEN